MDEPRPEGQAHRDHRRCDDRARPGVHPRGRRPQPRARDRQRHAQGRAAGGRGPQAKTVIDPKQLQQQLGPTRFEYGELESEDQIGSATGLVVTEVGGDVVAIEVTRMEGREDFILTGQLGEVMRESARAGLSWTRAHASELGIPGYCVTPQVGVGSYRIDLVVEGDNDRRLAVELDGDKWHPPEKWLEDMFRQRAMERMGWRFWRCWASSFLRDPGGCMADLVSMLTAMRIEAMAREARKNIYTEHRTVEASEPRMADSEPTSTPTESVIEIGDRVMVSYDDPQGQQAVLVVAADEHDPDMGIFRSSSPTGKALLRKTVDDEVTISVGDQSRSATILAIDKKEPPRGNSVPRSVHQQTAIQPDPLSERGTTTTSTPPRTPKPGYPQAQIPPTPKRQLAVEPRRTPGNRVIEELRVLDERFANPRCSQCSGPARVAIYTEGPVIVCADQVCNKKERVDVQTLQRLAERLDASCRQCKGTNLQSLTGSFGNYLRCRDCRENTSWQGVSERIGK